MISHTNLQALAAQTLVVIPARYGSSRFEGKPLALLAGTPMIAHVWHRVKESVFSSARVIIATDDDRIASVCKGFGAEVCMTRSDHPSGTDRVWEVAAQYPDLPYVLNVQGDEPLLEASHLEAILAGLSQWQALPYYADIVTLVTPLLEQNNPDFASLQLALENPNQVKAVRCQSGQVLYFSRSAIPFVREGLSALKAKNLSPFPFYRHLGLYFYQREALAAMTEASPSPLEELECLEQLRALELGLKIYAAVVPSAPPGVDTPADLAYAEKLLSLARVPELASSKLFSTLSSTQRSASMEGIGL